MILSPTSFEPTEFAENEIQGYINLRNIKGILFDVDGTLYYHPPLRLIMIALIILFHFYRPKELIRKLRIIAAYRQAQETIRRSTQTIENCCYKQLHLAAIKTGESLDFLQSVISEWFERRPLAFLRYMIRRNLKQVLKELKEAGFKLGVYSDYPVTDKISAMGIEDFFQLFLSAGNSSVKGFKPNTNGFDIAAHCMGLDPSEVLYVGDRDRVDGLGASKAGMPVLILNGWLLRNRKHNEYPTISSLKDVLRLLC